MKQLVLGFGQFVNEMFDRGASLEKKSSCCGASILEDGACSECGAFDPDSKDQEVGIEETKSKDINTEPSDV